ncbi:hypothetical protein RJT34_25361 [Clitoria ternatea]|uniref:Uncharacterized protein n=1 Tax=Clitoria ternatea TaxID=43366 RepID=A0AAN9IIT3_CLITE
MMHRKAWDGPSPVPETFWKQEKAGKARDGGCLIALMDEILRLVSAHIVFAGFLFFIELVILIPEVREEAV